MRKVRLGEYIEPCDERNSQGIFGENAVRGLATSKQIILTKANLDGVSLNSYKLLKPEEFAFVPDTSRRGDKMSLGYNGEDQTHIVSSISCVFRIKDKNKLLPEFLYLWFSCPEFDRYARFNSWGSAREAFSFSEMERVEIPLPSLDEQKAYVAAWQGLKELADSNAQMADPLFALCQSYLKELKQKYEPQEIGPYIEQSDERNSQGTFDVSSVRGISINKVIIDTKADMTGVSLTPYKLLKSQEFAFVTITSRNGEKISLAENTTDKMFIVSSSYEVFRIKDKNKLLPEFLYLWLSRPEFDRYARFNSWGSAREAFSFSEMCRVKIPLPLIEVQKAIVAIYRCAQENKVIASEAAALSKSICPALMRQAMAGGEQ